jgi:uncharacterized alpha-E superfamily protein
MLSRVADALYWMSRYVERAEHAARVAEVTRNVLIDLAEVDPKAAKLQWKGALAALAMEEKADVSSIAFDENDPASILSSLSRARENARQVREVISSEMWEHLNRAYWDMKEAAVDPNREDELSHTLGNVVTASFLWGGVTDGTMRRGEGWLFIKLGQFAERADRTSRLVSAVSEYASARSEDPAHNVPWIGLLRGVNGLEAFRKVHPTRIDPRQVLEFVILDREFPRTVRYSVAVAADFAARLAQEASDRSRTVERAFGRLAALLDYAVSEEIAQPNTREFLRKVLHGLAEASLTLQRTYFLH